jgi:hypothetical protein
VNAPVFIDTKRVEERHANDSKDRGLGALREI